MAPPRPDTVKQWTLKLQEWPMVSSDNLGGPSSVRPILAWLHGVYSGTMSMDGMMIGSSNTIRDMVGSDICNPCINTEADCVYQTAQGLERSCAWPSYYSTAIVRVYWHVQSFVPADAVKQDSSCVPGQGRADNRVIQEMILRQRHRVMHTNTSVETLEEKQPNMIRRIEDALEAQTCHCLDLHKRLYPHPLPACTVLRLLDELRQIGASRTEVV